MLSRTICAIGGITCCYISYLILTRGDGAVFTTVVGILAALGGYEYAKKKK